MAIAGFAFLVLRTPPRLSETISFLVGRPSKRTSTEYMLLMTPISASKTLIVEQEKFVLSEPSQEVIERLSREFGSRVQKAYLTTGQCTFLDVKGGRSDERLKVDVKPKGARESYLVITSSREATWMDRVRKWMGKTFEFPP